MAPSRRDSEFKLNTDSESERGRDSERDGGKEEEGAGGPGERLGKRKARDSEEPEGEPRRRGPAAAPPPRKLESES